MGSGTSPSITGATYDLPQPPPPPGAPPPPRIPVADYFVAYMSNIASLRFQEARFPANVVDTGMGMGGATNPSIAFP